jgi:hypothetical protein
MKKWASSDNAPLRPRFSCGRTFTVGVLAKRPDHRLGVLWEAGLNLPQTICGFHSPIVMQQRSRALWSSSTMKIGNTQKDEFSRSRLSQN